MKATSKADERYKAYIAVVDACSGKFNAIPVERAMREYARKYAITPSGIQSVARAIVANDYEMMLLAVHRWRTASDSFSQEDHNASLEWRAKKDPGYIAYQAKHGNAQDVRWTLKGTGEN